jgi:dolichol-phosphate mannosyltransferase
MPTHAHRPRQPSDQPPSSAGNLRNLWWTVDRCRHPRLMKLHDPAGEHLTVIVPTLNEEANIEPLVTRILAQSSAALQIEILVVDDGSTDKTCERALLLGQTHPVRLLQRERPTGGLAGAVLAGAAATESRWVLVMDADLSHPPERIGDLVAPLFDQSQDMVIGSRYAPGGRTPGWPWWRRLMSRVACLMAWPLAHLHDPLSGFFATDRAWLTRCKGDAAGFKIALELIVNATSGFRVKEVPIVFRDRERGESKIRLAVLFTYLVRLVVLLARRTAGRFDRSGTLPPPHAVKLPEVEI